MAEEHTLPQKIVIIAIVAGVLIGGFFFHSMTAVTGLAVATPELKDKYYAFAGISLIFIFFTTLYMRHKKYQEFYNL